MIITYKSFPLKKRKRIACYAVLIVCIGFAYGHLKAKGIGLIKPKTCTTLERV